MVLFAISNPLHISLISRKVLEAKVNCNIIIMMLVQHKFMTQGLVFYDTQWQGSVTLRVLTPWVMDLTAGMKQK